MWKQNKKLKKMKQTNKSLKEHNLSDTVQPLLMEELVQLLHKIERKLGVKIDVTISCNSEITTSGSLIDQKIIIVKHKNGKN